MHSYILTFSTIEQAHIHIKKITTIDDFDTRTVIPEGQSITIDQIRQSIDWIQLTPRNTTKNLIIHPAEALTPQAQHAILKTLEEPPSYAKIFLITTAPNQLLPTIRSRCLIITTTQQHQSIANPQIMDILKQKPILRLKHTSLYKDKPSSIQWLQSLVLETHTLIIQNQLSPNLGAQTINSLIQGIKALEGNTSIGLTLDNILLRLPST